MNGRQATADTTRPAEHELVLRPASPADRELLYRIYHSTRFEELAPAQWDPVELEGFIRFQFEAQDHFYHQHYPDALYRIIELAGTPIGRLYTARSPAELRIIDISLLPPWRGAGLGTALLRQLCAAADADRIPVTIHVELHNPARRLYERLGFRFVEERGLYLFMRREPA